MPDSKGGNSKKVSWATQMDDQAGASNHEVTLVLHAAALLRLEGARVEAELRFNDAVRRLLPSGLYDCAKQADLEVLLFEYILTIWMTFAEEALNSASPTWVARKHIEVYLNLEISRAFKEKHPSARGADSETELRRFGSATMTFIKLQSKIWDEVQKALQERAESELTEISHAATALESGEPNEYLNVSSSTTGVDPDIRAPSESNVAHPHRALWLKERLRERAWNKHDVERFTGPNHKTVQRILDGLVVQEDVLEKLARALSQKCKRVDLLDIPQD